MAITPNSLNMKKQTPNIASPSSQDILIRETLRISAELASTPLLDTTTISPPLESTSTSTVRFICCEEIDGRRWKYVADTDASGQFKTNSFRSLSLQTPKPPLDELMAFVRSYVVPEGFPDSVTPSYVPYMTWRALKHFFGGAMGVFTTQTLLSSVGVSRNRATPGAVAINWILKDGAGRVGKMLFARQGKKFDYDLKQLRFAGDLLMELGAGVELATAAAPHLFLPLACAANVLKNVAAVTSTSTRTPIYKAFAKGENIGDVTAKGECVGNIADLLGTGFSIMIAKRNPSLIATFSLLSCGYILSSYQEVKSVVLHTLNSARFSVAVESFLKTGQVPTLREGNLNEDIFSFPWKDKPVVLGSRIKDAFQDPSAYVAIEPLFDKERYIVTYNPSKSKVHAVLKDQAKSDDILKAAFHAHVLSSFIKSLNKSKVSSWKQSEDLNLNVMLSVADLEACVADSCKVVTSAYWLFKNKVHEQVMEQDKLVYSTSYYMSRVKLVDVTCRTTMEIG
ncbi:Protein root UVB sensitive 6 [Lathyrus oleraceus]|uniref:Protein root UVB sensitive 6 n=1 Tax=Pisum sativum TaxID=3888 RepID=A0A9D4X413_PEA|nr:Protein root UVB sensitive 6 [Pisum sativum]